MRRWPGTGAILNDTVKRTMVVWPGFQSIAKIAKGREAGMPLDELFDLGSKVMAFDNAEFPLKLAP